MSIEDKVNLKEKTPQEESGSEAKKQRMALPEAPASEWPECWVMPDGECEDQKKPNKKEPNEQVGVEALKELGIR